MVDRDMYTLCPTVFKISGYHLLLLFSHSRPYLYLYLFLFRARRPIMQTQPNENVLVRYPGL